MSEIREVEVGGLTLGYDQSDKIVKITQDISEPKNWLEVGQTVISNGRFGASEGVAGKIVEIHAPSTNGRTSDIVDVDFGRRGGLCMMKLKDLRLS